MLIDNILKSDLFDHFDRPKYAVDKFVELNQEQQHELIHDIAYQIEDIKHNLYDCYSIAKGDKGDE